MQSKQSYDRYWFRLDREFLQKVTKLDSGKSQKALLMAWIWIGIVVSTSRWLHQFEGAWWIYVPCIFFIAGRQGALLQLLHEGSHGLLSPERKRNNFYSYWICGYPLGLSPRGYIQGHLQHHGNTNTLRDPVSDREKYRATDFRKWKVYFLLLKDLLGITAIEVFLFYGDKGEEREKSNQAHWHRLEELGKTAVVQALLMTLLFQWQLTHYILFWIIPAISAHMFLMRVRGIAEHGLPRQLGIEIQRAGEGDFYTRSFLTPQNSYKFSPLIWLEKCLIGSLLVHYHHEHHLFPNVPFYHLPKVHAAIKEKVAAINPNVYAKGYFAAALAEWHLSPNKARNPVLVSPKGEAIS